MAEAHRKDLVMLELQRYNLIFQAFDGTVS